MRYMEDGMKKLLFTLITATFALACLMTASAADDTAKVDERLTKAGNIIQELTSPNTTAGIPHKVLEDAKCIAVVPGLKQAGFIVGGHHGDGVATCKLTNGRWSPRSFPAHGRQLRIADWRRECRSGDDGDER